MVLDEWTSTQNADSTETSDRLLRSTGHILRTRNQTNKNTIIVMLQSLCVIFKFCSHSWKWNVPSSTWSTLKKKWYEDINHRVKLTWNLYYGIKLKSVSMSVSVCSIKMPFSKFSSTYLKLMSKAETVNFSSKHDDCEWFPFQTVKLVTESFEKVHVIISLLLRFVKFQSRSLQVYVTRSQYSPHSLSRKLFWHAEFQGCQCQLAFPSL